MVDVSWWDNAAKMFILSSRSQRTCAILRPALLRSCLYFLRLLLNIQHF